LNIKAKKTILKVSATNNKGGILNE